MRNTAALPYLLIAPATIFLALLFFVPLVQTVALALTPDGSVEFGNFARMLDDLDFRDSVVNTFSLVVIVIPIQLVLALAMSIMLQHMRRGRDVILWIWTIPLGVSDLASGLVWLAILNERGYLNTFLYRIGVIAEPQSWLTYETPFALLIAVAVAEIWRATAIVVIILVAGLQLVPKEFGEAAAVFGASPWRRFRHVTLPLLRPSIQSALILRTVLAFEAFAVVLAIGGTNFPVLVSQAYLWENSNQAPGVAAAYAVVVMAISLAATVVYLRVLRTPAGQRA